MEGSVALWCLSISALATLIDRGLELGGLAFGEAATACEKSSQWEQALGVMVALRRNGLATDIGILCAVAGACAKAGAWAVAVLALESAYRQDLAPTQSTCSSVTHACAKASKLDLVSTLLIDMRQRRLQLDAAMDSLAIQAHTMGGHASQVSTNSALCDQSTSASDLAVKEGPRERSQDAQRPSVSDSRQDSRLDGASRAMSKQLEQSKRSDHLAVTDHSWSGTAGPSTPSKGQKRFRGEYKAARLGWAMGNPVLKDTLMRAIHLAESHVQDRAGLVSAGASSLKAVQQLLEQAHVQGLEYGSEGHGLALSALVDIAARQRDVDAAEHWFQVADDAGVAVDLFTVTPFIHAAGSRGDFARAERWFRRSLEAGLECNVVPLTALIDAAATSREFRTAEQWFLWALKAGVSCNVVTVTALIKAAGKSGVVLDEEQRESYFLASGVQPNLITYGAMMEAARPNAEAVENILDLAIRRNLVPNNVMYNTVIDAFARVGNLERGVFHFTELAKIARPDVASFTSLINGAAIQGNFEQAQLWFEQMEETCIANVFSWNALFKALRNSRSPRTSQSALVEKLFEAMVSDRGVMPDKATLTMLDIMLGDAAIVDDLCWRFGIDAQPLRSQGYLRRERVRASPHNEAAQQFRRLSRPAPDIAPQIDMADGERTHAADGLVPRLPRLGRDDAGARRRDSRDGDALAVIGSILFSTSPTTSTTTASRKPSKRTRPNACRRASPHRVASTWAVRSTPFPSQRTSK
mmetsp:Transcript_77883/g.251949  ORF Transcript_77883/g.251949 Transcript_77883/m.251949 type:complete len:754 (+) Transcript_77883:64-2325(+)